VTILADAPARRPALPFTAPWLLAPMEGITEPCFRELVLARNPPAVLGGAFTEFVRVSQAPLPARVLRAHLGPEPAPERAPVGLQLMGSDPELVTLTAQRAVAAGAPLVDLNFGCPAKGALRGCAGSALLRDPRALERLVSAVVTALPGTPVTAKIRAGYDDTELLLDNVRAVERAGAALLTVHCRTRAEAYQREVDWSRIARAVAAVQIPVCGNGGVKSHADLERMRRATGCAYVMVGQGALADPWIFSGHTATRAEARAFLLEYAARLSSSATARPAARVKQLLRHWSAGGLVDDEIGERERLLRLPDALLFDALRAAPSTQARPSAITDPRCSSVRR
jgi:tRNA-dihydrouridine synthase C